MSAQNGDKVKLTLKGKEKLERELQELKTTGRDEISEFMASIMAEGDISENSGYDDARAKMGALESRILELEHILSHARIVEDATSDTVAVGSTVTVQDEKGRERRFVIVGTHEVDALQGHISDESPIGQALIGRHVGEKVAVETPRGKQRLVVSSISMD
ncbi:MAG TPA: transcription elongation factor GreA [Deinococcales bacterium]|nr:transcription elongation factor GreA [Deinococcales bacterium]